MLNQMNLCLIGEFKMEHSRQLLGHPTCNHFLDLLINNLIAIAECNEEPGSENCQNHVPDGRPTDVRTRLPRIPSFAIAHDGIPDLAAVRSVNGSR